MLEGDQKGLREARCQNDAHVDLWYVTGPVSDDVTRERTWETRILRDLLQDSVPHVIFQARLCGENETDPINIVTQVTLMRTVPPR